MCVCVCVCVCVCRFCDTMSQYLYTDKQFDIRMLFTQTRTQTHTHARTHARTRTRICTRIHVCRYL